MLVLQRRSRDASVLKSIVRMNLADRLRLLRGWQNRRNVARAGARRPGGYGPFSDDRGLSTVDLIGQIPSCDVINLHWVAHFVDYRLLGALMSRRLPIVWTLHDMNPFTGGCHYDNGCGRYMDCCGACPQLGSTIDADPSRRAWKRKQRALQELESDCLHLVAPSQWMADAVRRSSLLGRFPVTTIPYGLDVDIFSPRSAEVGRRALEIPCDASVVLFVAHSVSVQRKGLALLSQALASLHDLPALFLLSLGSGAPDVEGNIPHLHVGHISQERLLALLYSTADVYVVPSLQDNLPNTVLESLACGTPVVGFDVGGIPDMVRPGVTGLLAPVGEVVGLSAAIAEVLQDDVRRAEMSRNSRCVAEDEYSLKVQAQRYLELYESLVRRQKRKRWTASATQAQLLA